MECSIQQLLDCYSKLVLAAVDDDNEDPLWYRFYTIQMAAWILTRKSLKFVLDDAISAYEKICISWDELDRYMQSSLLPVKNFDNVFKMVHVPFDIDQDTITEEENNDFLIFGSN